jgi:hypothetical protein
LATKHSKLSKNYVSESLVTPNNDVKLEIQSRIQTAKRCLFGLRKQPQAGHLSRSTKYTIYKSLIRPVLLYGSETWVLTTDQSGGEPTARPREEGAPKNKNGVFRRRYISNFCLYLVILLNFTVEHYGSLRNVSFSHTNSHVIFFISCFSYF